MDFIGLDNDYIAGVFVKETMQSGRKGIFNGLESLTSNLCGRYTESR